jgi:hypothetical protein
VRRKRARERRERWEEEKEGDAEEDAEEHVREGFFPGVGGREAGGRWRGGGRRPLIGFQFGGRVNATSFPASFLCELKLSALPGSFLPFHRPSMQPSCAFTPQLVPSPLKHKKAPWIQRRRARSHPFLVMGSSPVVTRRRDLDSTRS